MFAVVVGGMTADAETPDLEAAVEAAVRDFHSPAGMSLMRSTPTDSNNLASLELIIDAFFLLSMAVIFGSWMYLGTQII